MKKLDKELIAKRDSLVKNLREAAGELETAVSEFNDALDDLKLRLQEKIDDYNMVLQEADSWRADVTGAMEEYYDERSDKWQDSPAGDAYSAWISEYQQLDLDEIDIDMPDNVDMPDVSNADEIENLPEQPDEE